MERTASRTPHDKKQRPQPFIARPPGVGGVHAGRRRRRSGQVKEGERESEEAMEEACRLTSENKFPISSPRCLKAFCAGSRLLSRHVWVVSTQSEKLDFEE